MHAAHKRHTPLRTSRKQTVVLFGEILADIFPDRSVLGGAPFNVARHLKAFAQKPVLITRLGSDALRDKIMHTLSQNGMETLGVQSDKNHPTGQVKVKIKDGVNHFEILPLQAYDFIHPAIVRMTSLSVHPDMVYFGTMAQRHETSGLALKTLLRSTYSPKFLDINLRAPWYDEKVLRQSLQFADIVKLNAEELRTLAEMLEIQGDSPQEQARALMNQFDIKQAVVTCGEEGAWQINPEGRKIEAGVKNPVTHMVDTVGAGDGFAAVYIFGMLHRWSVPVTLERANAFAGALCGIRGAIPDHADFYEPFLKDWNI